VDIGDLLEAMDHLHGYIPFAEFRDVFNSQCFVIEGQRVRIVSEEVDRLKLRYCETVDTDTEEKRKKSVEAVISAMNVLITEHPDVKAVKLVIPGLVTVDQNNGLQPSPSFVKSGKI
jgi:predicted NBD/HSP70 family sugar kinase